MPEHTWGLDIKKGLADFSNWSNADFQACIAAGDERYMRTIAQWHRQRQYMTWALEALSPLQVKLRLHVHVCHAAVASNTMGNNDTE